MFSKLWFRFGIPLGSATVLAALLDFAIASYWFLNDFGSFLYIHVWDRDEPTDYRTYLGLVGVSLRVVLALSLWVFILLGHRVILLLWLPLSVIDDFLIIGHGINNTTHDDFISDERWFLNLAVVIIIRMYLTVVIYQAFYRLLQNAKVEALIKTQQQQELETIEDNGENGIAPNAPNNNGANSFNNGQPICNNATANAINHLGNLHRKSTPVDQSHSNSSSPRFLLIEPIGYSPEVLWDFYNDTPRLGAAILVTFEVVWNIFTLCSHSMTEFLFGGRIFFMPREEELFMRIWRLIIGTAAMIFIFNRKKTLLRFWLIVYFWTLFASLCIFVYVMSEWFDPPPIVVIITVIIWFGDNTVRFGILYFVLRVTTSPPPSPSTNPQVARSHSLRSQSRPRSRTRRTTFNRVQRNRVVFDEFNPAISATTVSNPAPTTVIVC